MSGRIQLDAQQALQELADFNRKLLRGSELLKKTKGDDVQIATTPKHEVFRQDKTVLYRYEPLAKRSVETPILVVFGLVGRYTFIDLQEDRSLMRNLLGQGLDIYVVDWGSPSRADRWLSLEDYIEGYLNECVEHICRECKVDSITLLGICEGGVFCLAYSAIKPLRRHDADDRPATFPCAGS